MADQYESILNLILEDTPQNDETKVSAFDYRLVDGAEKQDPDNTEYSARNHLYTELTQDYINANKSKVAWNKGYKLVFFIISMILLLGTVIGAFTALIVVCNKPCVGIEDVIAVLGGMTSFVSAIIILPKIIAEHLFPTNEDANMIGMIKNMQINDSGIRDHLRKKSQKQDK